MFGCLKPLVYGKAVHRKRRITSYFSKKERYHVVHWYQVEGGDALLLLGISTWTDSATGRKLQWKRVVAVFVRSTANKLVVVDWLRHHLRFLPDVGFRKSDGLQGV